MDRNGFFLFVLKRMNDLVEDHDIRNLRLLDIFRLIVRSMRVRNRRKFLI